jgi:hypothetical protein
VNTDQWARLASMPGVAIWRDPGAAVGFGTSFEGCGMNHLMEASVGESQNAWGCPQGRCLPEDMKP